MNPRNTAGSIKLLDSKEVRRPLECFLYSMFQMI